MWRLRRALPILLGSSLCLAQRPPLPRPELTPQDEARGKELFLGHCAPCHGPRGEGGRGAILAKPRLLHAPDDEALFDVIRQGIPGTEMPASALYEREPWQVLAYVKKLGRMEPQPVPGNPARGEQLYRTKGNCVQCHMIQGEGGQLGPDLSDAGARRGADFLRESIVDPEAAVPENFSLYRKVAFLPDNFLLLRVVTNDGRRITGVRVNEDAFSIQLRDFSDRYHSFYKSELVELHKDWGKSPMPSYRNVFTAEQLDDLVAYLASLRGNR